MIEEGRRHNAVVLDRAKRTKPQDPTSPLTGSPDSILSVVTRVLETKNPAVQPGCPTPFPHLVSHRDLMERWKSTKNTAPKRPKLTRQDMLLSYPARIRTWKNRTKTCCDTVSPPGNRACSLATRCSSGKTTRRRKRRFGSSGPCTQGSRAERSDPRPRR